MRLARELPGRVHRPPAPGHARATLPFEKARNSVPDDCDYHYQYWGRYRLWSIATGHANAQRRNNPHVRAFPAERS
jgi:hypothetical protein